ncbi:hypothetical protein [Citrobacter sp. EC_71]|uniref:hypothetical protein n=1 Tax=Citrobacter sp. EC_71 TaxID=2584093 RepID=UPI001C707E87|nr:hypothetical protein [Citrobacter sp. EC_71]
MSEPITIASGVTSDRDYFRHYVPGGDAWRNVMRAAGAAMYVLTPEPHQLWKQMLFAVIPFMGGVFFSVPMIKILAGVINSALGLLQPSVSIEVSPNVGAKRPH